jgi:hypothetical protein
MLEKVKKMREQVQPLTYLANKKLTQQQYKQNKQLVQDLFETNPSIVWSRPFYQLRSKTAGRAPIPQGQVKEKALEKKFKIFSHIRQKEKNGFDVFPLFFMDIEWVGGLESLWQTFGQHYFSRILVNDPEKSLYYIGNVHNRFYWFVVNWFNDRRKKVFVVYERTPNSGRVSVMLRPDHYGNINVPTILPHGVIDYTNHVEKLQTFFREARLIGVYSIDYGFRYDFATDNWLVPN